MNSIHGRWQRDVPGRMATLTISIVSLAVVAGIVVLLFQIRNAQPLASPPSGSASPGVGSPVPTPTASEGVQALPTDTIGTPGLPDSLSDALAATAFVLDGQSPWLVGTLGGDTAGLVAPANSQAFPGGRLIIMITPEEDALALFVVDAATGESRRLGDFPTSDEYRVVADRGGTTVYMHGSSSTHDNGLRAYDLGGGPVRDLIAREVIDDESVRLQLHLSASGKTLASALCNWEVCRVDIVSTEDNSVRRLPLRMVPIATTDQALLARGTTGRQIYDFATDTARPLTGDLLGPLTAAFSIDDEHLVFDASNSGIYSVFDLSMSDGGARVLYTHSYEDNEDEYLHLVADPLVSPDWILFGPETKMWMVAYYHGLDAELTALRVVDGTLESGLAIPHD
jgi:hypothetical protein